MPYVLVLWDLEEDPNGNAQHIADSGITKEEIEELLRNPADADRSRSTGYPVVFGDTSSGRHLMVVYEEIDDETAYPITAFEVKRRKRR